MTAQNSEATLKTRGADLSKLPKSFDKPAPPHVSIGDIHGNALKLIYTLAEEGVLRLSEDNYARLHKIYYTNISDLTKDEIKEFKKIIAEITVSTDTAVTLIGDELADRGSNDYFTLLVLKKLHESNVDLDILISNHSVEFITDYARGQFKGKGEVIGLAQSWSLTKMVCLISDGRVEEQEIKTIVKDCYIPTIKAISYTVSPDSKSITLFTHAPVGLETIKALAKTLNINYKDGTILELTSTIDSINEQVRTQFSNNGLVTLIQNESKHDERYSPVPATSPFHRLTWNRLVGSELETKTSGGVDIKFVHGHVGRVGTRYFDAPLTENPLSHTNLDNDLGKTTFTRNEIDDNEIDENYLTRHSYELTANALKKQAELRMTNRTIQSDPIDARSELSNSSENSITRVVVKEKEIKKTKAEKIIDKLASSTDTQFKLDKTDLSRISSATLSEVLNSAKDKPVCFDMNGLETTDVLNIKDALINNTELKSVTFIMGESIALATLLERISEVLRKNQTLTSISLTGIPEKEGKEVKTTIIEQAIKSNTILTDFTVVLPHEKTDKKGLFAIPTQVEQYLNSNKKSADEFDGILSRLSGKQGTDEVIIDAAKLTAEQRKQVYTALEKTKVSNLAFRNFTKDEQANIQSHLDTNKQIPKYNFRGLGFIDQKIDVSSESFLNENETVKKEFKANLGNIFAARGSRPGTRAHTEKAAITTHSSESPSAPVSIPTPTIFSSANVDNALLIKLLSSMGTLEKNQGAILLALQGLTRQNVPESISNQYHSSIETSEASNQSQPIPMAVDDNSENKLRDNSRSPVSVADSSVSGDVPIKGNQTSAQSLSNKAHQANTSNKNAPASSDEEYVYFDPPEGPPDSTQNKNLNESEVQNASIKNDAKPIFSVSGSSSPSATNEPASAQTKYVIYANPQCASPEARQDEYAFNKLPHQNKGHQAKYHSLATPLDDKQQGDLMSKDGLKVTSPSGVDYSFRLDKGIPIATLWDENLFGETAEQKQLRDVMAIINMIDNVLVYSNVVKIKTEDPVLATVANEYIKHLSAIGLTKITLSISSPPPYAGHETAMNIFKDLKENLLDEKKLVEAPWYKQALAFQSELPNAVSNNVTGHYKANRVKEPSDNKDNMSLTPSLNPSKSG